MSLDFVNWPVVWVPVWLLVTGAYGHLAVWAQRRCPSEVVDSLQHARTRVVQTFAAVMWVLYTLMWGPGNLLPALWSDLAGVLALPAMVVTLFCLRRTLRKFDELEKREAEVLSSEKSTVK